METSELHVMMLPWCAFGHLIPYFRLSLALAKSGIRISFVSTPKSILRLPEIPPNLQSLIRFVEFPMPVLDHNPLPEGAEATIDVPSSKVLDLMAAYDLLQHPLKQFLAVQKIDWIVFDVFPHWITDIAQECKIPLVCFDIIPAFSSLILGPPDCFTSGSQRWLRPSWESMTSKPEWIDFPSSLAYRKSEAIVIYQRLYSVNGSGISVAERRCKAFKSCNAFAVRGCKEFEGAYIDRFEELLQKPVIPAGMLPLEKPESSEAEQIKDGSWSQVFKWLDQQKPKSVVYVAFGSEYTLSKDEVFEVAYGLELSGLPFIWALRKPIWAKSEIDALPDGFNDRVSGRGFVSFEWAPQMEILGHPAVGGSLNHCGWGTIAETLQFGLCLILLPLLVSDQPLIAKYLKEKGLGVEVERNEEDGSFTRDGIANALKIAMVSDESKNLRDLASVAAEIFGNEKLEQDCIDKFVEFLKTREYKS